MKKCHVCELDIQESDLICNNCGYDFDKREIVDKERLISYKNKLAREKNWIEEINLMKRVNDIQIKKHGLSSTHPEKYGQGGWSMIKTAKLFGGSRHPIPEYIKLAEELEKHPELLKCKNKSQTIKKLKDIKDGIHLESNESKFESEQDLQKYLYNNWEKTAFNDGTLINKEWELQRTNIEGKYIIGEIGEIDLLAKHLEENRWLVIELKIDQSSDETVAQLLRYMGWVKENCANENGKVEGLIIAKSMDEKIRLALLCTSNIELKIYKFESDELRLYSPNFALLIDAYEKSNHKGKEEILRYIETKRTKLEN